MAGIGAAFRVAVRNTESPGGNNHRGAPAARGYQSGGVALGDVH